MAAVRCFTSTRFYSSKSYSSTPTSITISFSAASAILKFCGNEWKSLFRICWHSFKYRFNSKIAQKTVIGLQCVVLRLFVWYVRVWSQQLMGLFLTSSYLFIKLYPTCLTFTSDYNVNCPSLFRRTITGGEISFFFKRLQCRQVFTGRIYELPVLRFTHLIWKLWDHFFYTRLK